MRFAESRFLRRTLNFVRGGAWIGVVALLGFLLWIPAFEGQTQVQAAGPASVAGPSGSSPGVAGVFDPTKPETQPSLEMDRDPILAPEAPAKPEANPVGAVGEPPTGSAKELTKQKNGIYTLSEDVNEVLLNCAVVDARGNLVTDLKQSDFKVWEDGVPQTINSFRRQDLPAALGILVDNSGSMRDKRAAVEAAALDLVRASNPQDTVFIVNFSDRAYLDQNPTSDISLLQRGLSRFDARGTTALYDAVAASADELSTTAEQSRQVLLIVTDGADNASRLTLQQAVRRVQLLGGPVVYSIGMLYGTGATEAREARAALETLSADTGGIAYFPNSLSQVDEIAREIARDIREQYILGYRPTRRESLAGFRSIRVEASARGYRNLSVRTRHGYYPKSLHQNHASTEQASQAGTSPTGYPPQRRGATAEQPQAPR